MLISHSTDHRHSIPIDRPDRYCAIAEKGAGALDDLIIGSALRYFVTDDDAVAPGAMVPLKVRIRTAGPRNA